MPRISLENAARDLSEIIERARSKDTSFESISEGEVVARIVPAKPPNVLMLEIWIQFLQTCLTLRPGMPCDLPVIWIQSAKKL